MLPHTAAIRPASDMRALESIVRELARIFKSLGRGLNSNPFHIQRYHFVNGLADFVLTVRRVGLHMKEWNPPVNTTQGLSWLRGLRQQSEGDKNETTRRD